MGAIEDVKASFGRCMAEQSLFDTFYDIFLASHPDIRPRFATTDFDRQKVAIRQGLNLAIMYAAGNPVGEGGLERIRASHARTRLNIPPDLYKYWKESMLEAVSRTDPRYDASLARSWDEVLQQAVDFIAGGYHD
jgi:hemoglobin-like flavoprotein